MTFYALHIDTPCYNNGNEQYKILEYLLEEQTTEGLKI